MNQEVVTTRRWPTTWQVLRWVRIVCIIALALVVGYVSRDWPRQPMWKKQIPLGTILAGVSDVRNEVVLVSQFDTQGNPIVGTSIMVDRDERKRDRDGMPAVRFRNSATQDITPARIEIETLELSSGRRRQLQTVMADWIYTDAGLAEHSVTLSCRSGGIVQLDRTTGKTLFKHQPEKPGYCSVSPNGLHYYEINHGVERIHTIGGKSVVVKQLLPGTNRWSPDGNRFAMLDVDQLTVENDGACACKLRIIDLRSGNELVSPSFRVNDSKSTWAITPTGWIDDNRYSLVTSFSRTKLGGKTSQFPDRLVLFRITDDAVVQLDPSQLVVTDKKDHWLTETKLADGTWLGTTTAIPLPIEEEVVKWADASKFNWLTDMVKAIRNQQYFRVARGEALGTHAFHLNLIIRTIRKRSERDRFLVSQRSSTEPILLVHDLRMPSYPIWLHQMGVTVLSVLLSQLITTIPRFIMLTIRRLVRLTQFIVRRFANKTTTQAERSIRRARLARTLRWMIIILSSVIVGNLLRDYPRGPDQTINLAGPVLLAGVSDERNELVFVEQFDQQGKIVDPSDLNTIRVQRNSSQLYQTIRAGAKVDVVPGSLRMSAYELSTGKVRQQITCPISQFYRSAWGNQSSVTLEEGSSLPMAHLNRTNRPELRIIEDTQGKSRSTFLKETSPKGKYRVYSVEIGAKRNFEVSEFADGRTILEFSIPNHKDSIVKRWSPSERFLAVAPAKVDPGMSQRNILVFDLAQGKQIGQLPLPVVPIPCNLSARWLDDEHLAFADDARAVIAPDGRVAEVVTRFQTWRITFEGKIEQVMPTRIIVEREDGNSWYYTERVQLPDQSWLSTNRSYPSPLKRWLEQLNPNQQFPMLKRLVDSISPARLLLIERSQGGSWAEPAVRVTAPTGDYVISDKHHYAVVHPKEPSRLLVYHLMPRMPAWFWQSIVTAISLVGLTLLSWLCLWLFRAAKRVVYRT